MAVQPMAERAMVRTLDSCGGVVVGAEISCLTLQA